MTCSQGNHNNNILKALTLLLLSGSALADDLSDDSLDELFVDDLPVVLSATRLRQPRAEAPASITTIDAETIKNFGIRGIHELFRLVPGMFVGYERGSVPEVGYHTLAGENSHYLQVLVDGRSVYQPALARILWNDLPLIADNIARIEVIRGPNTVVYGANSYLAVINIITRQPDDLLGWSVSTTHGPDSGIHDTQFRWGGQHNEFSLAVTGAFHSDDGFDINSENELRNDQHEGHFVNVDALWQTQESNYIRLQGGMSDTDKNIDDINSLQEDPFHSLNTKNQFFQFTWNHPLTEQHELKVQAYHSRQKLSQVFGVCAPALFLSDELFQLYDVAPAYTNSLVAALLSGQPAPTPTDPAIIPAIQQVLLRAANGGADTVCGDANQNLTEERFDIEIQDTWTIDKTKRLVGGMSYREDDVNSKTYLNGRVSKSILRAFANFEWKPSDHWAINLGAMFEDDDQIGAETSPRVAVNYLLSPQQSFRFIVSRANRSPDLFEQDADWSYQLTDLSQPVNPQGSTNSFYIHSNSSGNLQYEQILSKEIGWYMRSNDQLWEVDVKLYKDRLYNLLEGLTQLDDFRLENTGAADLSGIDTQIRWMPTPEANLWLSVSHVDIDHATSDVYERSGSPINVSLNGFYRFNNGVHLSTGYYYYEEWLGAEFRRLDTSIAYTFNIFDLDINTRLTLEHRFDDNYLLDTRSRYDSPNKVYATFSTQW
ncbi:TonB-dependent siderophore receptor [Pleionea sp. CnH1-48]|uniref:TonB-dependent receptor plug domain-containing protein n=1 Tax=Pleionea sp. CnH1-48 TaxID=2954494 RepID=UPI0020969BD0|nr:TonB-dependent receptor [Pleionea sp. CnH1-48]MCO7224041.1 TonB-dependent receptor [Pleionea sp. CnH1-48]